MTDQLLVLIIILLTVQIIQNSRAVRKMMDGLTFKIGRVKNYIRRLRRRS